MTATYGEYAIVIFKGRDSEAARSEILLEGIVAGVVGIVVVHQFDRLTSQCVKRVIGFRLPCQAFVSRHKAVKPNEAAQTIIL